MPKRYCLTLDLKDDPTLIDQYEQYHRNIWNEVEESIREAGITGMEIFRLGNRLCMIMEADDAFSFDRKARLDAANPRVQEWETLMWQFQQPLPQARNGEKWLLMNKIFDLNQ